MAGLGEHYGYNYHRELGVVLVSDPAFLCSVANSITRASLSGPQSGLLLMAVDM